MRDLKKRLESLEAAQTKSAMGPQHWIIGEPGQSADEALRAYEAANGPVGCGDNVVVWEVVGAD